MVDDTPPMQVTIRTPQAQAYMDAHPQLTGDVNGGAPNGGMVDASSILADAPLPQAPSGEVAPRYAPTQVPVSEGGGVIDASDVLKAHPLISADMSNEQILHSIGLPKNRVAEITNDPTYKSLNAVEPDFLAKEVSEPNSTVPLLKDNPAFGAFIQSADESAFGVARLLTHALHSVGGVPDTTTDLMDAWSKVNDLAWQGRNGIRPQDYQANYTVPKIAGAVALAAAPGLMAAPAAIGRGIAGALTAPAEATLAAAPAAALATPLTTAGQVAKYAATGAGVAGGGATQAAAMANPQVDFTAQPKDRQDQYWKQTTHSAKEGALFALGLHNIAAGGYAAAKWGISKSTTAQKIAAQTQELMAHIPKTREGFVNFMKNYAPLFSKPEFAEREANFAANDVAPKLNQITHGATSGFFEKTLGSLPFGMGRINAKQGKELGAVAHEYSADAYDKMINTKFDNMHELEEAARSGGPKSEAAQRILEEMKQAGTTPARVAQLSAEGKGVREWLISRKKFAKVQELAAGAKMPTEKPLAKVNELIKDLAQRDNPDAGLLTRLTKIKNNLEGSDELNTYGRFENRKEELADLIKQHHGTPTEGKLIELQRAMQQAQHDFAENIHKYAKSERYGILAKDTAPYFKASKGEGYNFTAMRPTSAVEAEPGVRMFAPGNVPQASPEGWNTTNVKLKSPIIVEGQKGLNEFKQKLGLPVDNKFKNAEDLKADWEATTEKATQYAKSSGHDGVVFTKDGVPQSVIDMTRWKKQIGNDATDALQNYRKNIGAQGSAVRGARQGLTTANPDNIIDNALDKKGAETATNYYNSLDDKGRAALRVATINRAIKLGVDKDGNFDPSKVSKYFRDRQESVNVFFKGEDRWNLNGFTNLMDEAKAHSGGGHGLTGTIMMAEAASEVIKDVGNMGHAAVEAATTYAALSATGAAVRLLSTSPKFRHFLVAASDTKPGSPAMQKIYDKVMSLVDQTAAGAAAKQGVKQ